MNCTMCPKSAEITLVGRSLCLACAHGVIDGAAAYHAEVGVRVARARATAPAARAGVVRGEAGVFVGNRFLRGWKPTSFRRQAAAY